jgi:hypothetical protein
MSPTVPPTSTITTSTRVTRHARMRSLISLVMCGITCTVPAEVVAAPLLRDHAW